MKQQGKLACWLLCFALCFCMVLALVPATEAAAACAHVDQTVKDGRCDICQGLMAPVQLIQTSASLEGNICVNYFMLLSDEVANDKDAYIQFTMADGEEIQTSVRDSKLIDGYDVFTCEVDAKEMTDIITMQFFYGNGQPALAEAHPYNVRAYAQHVMKHYTDEKTQDLMTAMVNYGAASQLHFDYHTDDLANYDKDGNLMVTVPDYENVHITEFGFTPGQGTQNVKLYSASLLLNSETTLRLFFNGKISATHNGKNLDVKQRSGLYYVDIVGIAARELDDDVTITINDGTESANIVFSPMSYCQIVEQDTSGAYDTEMKNLVRALYLYNKAADEYFGDAVIGPQGTNMVNALHYLNGDKNNTKITEQVNSVTFGRSRDYRNIVRENTGILMDEEQDVPVYVYYILNGEKYDLYFLANDDIYLPKYSYQLFYNGVAMSSLTSVNTQNLNTSRAENMARMFRNCTALVDVDVSNFDTSSVTAIDHMFYICSSLTKLNVSGWDVSKVTSLQRMFYKCGKLSQIEGLSNWNTGNVTNMSSMFYLCSSLTDVGDLTNWDTSNVTTMQTMFDECSSLKTLKADNWNTGKVTNFVETFYGCTNLERVEAANWKTGNVTAMNGMFWECPSLMYLDVSKWDVSNVQNFYSTFTNCQSLPALDVSNWNTSNVTNMSFMFKDCSSLQTLDVSEWNVSKVDTFAQFMYNCSALTKLDVSNWDTSSATRMDWMFAECRNLSELDPSGFNVSKVTTMADMFNACKKLTALDLSNWDVSNVTSMHAMFGVSTGSGSMALQTVNLEGWNPTNVNDLSFMFYGCNQLTEVDMGGWNMPKMRTVSHLFADNNKLTSVDLSGWNTPSLEVLDAMFNDCHALTELDVSDIDTAKVKEFSQVFEACWNLKTITGLENWNTTSAATFTQMFSGCSALTELNLSSFNTRSAWDGYTTENDKPGFWNPVFGSMFSGVNSLQKLTLGADFCFTANGAAVPVVLPNPASIDGQATKWYNAENDTYYDASTIPEPTDKAVTYVAAGATMYNALHYLNGDKTSTKITTAVNSVTFDLKENHPDIVNNNTGILMDVEQDTPAYVYYILNGEKYDLYFLSNDAIYAPANVAGLFKGMTNLTAVETGNFNVSRAENMNQWFRKCGALKSVSGIEKWDTSAVTNMSSMFRECGVSGNLNLTGWNVSNVTTMKTMFYRCPNAFSLNAKGWDTGNVTDMSYMFTECSKLLSVNAAGWDTSEVTTMYVMFAQCGSLTTLNATGWNTSKVTDVRLMFQGDRSLATVDGSGGWNLASVTKAECMFDTCSSLTELDVASWNLSKADTLWNMFVKCTNLTTLNGEENWKLSSATTTNFMFQDCYKLQELSVRNWDMSSVTSMEAMFFACYNLRELDVTDWDVSKVTNFRYWIGSANQNEGDMKLEKIIGTENWRPVSAVNIGSMFYGCGQLTELNLSGWDMPNMTNANHMFADCYKLKSINLSGWNTPSVFSIDCMFNHCKALSTIDLSSFTTNNVLEFSQLFEGCESLTEITGLKNFNTAKGASFSEMFSGCKSLKVLDLSSFDTRGANESYKYHYTHVTDYSEGFENMFANMTSLEKLVLGENFSFDGDGKVTTAGYKCVLPNPAPIDGQATKWYNAETDTYYDASEIPQHTDKAVTYVAAVPPANP